MSIVRIVHTFSQGSNVCQYMIVKHQKLVINCQKKTVILRMKEHFMNDQKLQEKLGRIWSNCHN